MGVESAFEKDLFASVTGSNVLCGVFIKFLNCEVQPFILTDFFWLLDQLLKEVY